MKKFLKSFIATLLAVTMVIGCIPAFASDSADMGEEFTVSDTGYYNVLLSDGESSAIYNESDTAYNFTYTNTASDYAVYYLEKDTPYYSMDEFNGEYLGEEIISVSFDDSTALKNLILGADIIEGETDFYFFASANINFSSEKSLWVNGEIPFVCENGIAEGENNIVPDVPVYSGEAIVLTAFPAEKFVSDTYFKNANRYTTAYLDYKDTICFEDYSKAEVVIRCSNGTKEVVLNDYAVVNTHDNKNYRIEVDSEVTANAPVRIRIYLVGEEGSVELKSYDCKVVEASPLFNKDRVLYYYEKELRVVATDIIRKYESYKNNSFLKVVMLPVIFAEYFARTISLYVEYMRDGINFVFEDYNSKMNY